MILGFKKFDNLLLYLSLKVGVHFMNSQHLRLKWLFEKLDKYGPRSLNNYLLVHIRLECLIDLSKLQMLFGTSVQTVSTIVCSLHMTCLSKLISRFSLKLVKLFTTSQSFFIV